MYYQADNQLVGERWMTKDGRCRRKRVVYASVAVTTRVKWFLPLLASGQQYTTQVISLYKQAV